MDKNEMKTSQRSEADVKEKKRKPVRKRKGCGERKENKKK
jgi:hypothetical protein